MSADPHAVSFPDALARVSAIDGWLTDAQARRLWHAAREVPGGGTVVEIGSFRGRSTVLLGLAVPRSVTVTAIDPHAGSDRGPGEIAADRDRGNDDHSVFRANLEAAGLAGSVRHIRKFSGDALDDVAGEIDVLYIDGAHRYAPALADIRQWGERVRVGGAMLIHDSFNAVGLTLAMLHSLLLSPEFRYLGRDGSLAHYRRQPMSKSERRRNVAAQLRQLPYFFRMVLVKMALTVRLPAVARALGHRSGNWPY